MEARAPVILITNARRVIRHPSNLEARVRVRVKARASARVRVSSTRFATLARRARVRDKIRCGN